MKAVGLFQYLPIEDEKSLQDLEVEMPMATGRDVLVKVKAISVNPVDSKIRAPKDKVEVQPKILGWDAAGEVAAIGSEVEHFVVGDSVFYAGDVTRPGANCEYHLVDERIVGKKPDSLSFSEAAALPLTSITAWESLFDRMGISSQGEDEGKSVLIIGGAGGVGSIAIQLAARLAKLNVIATASRDESRDWCIKFGANQVINHANALDDELKNIGVAEVDYILCLNNTDAHWQAMVNAIKPQGVICSVVETVKANLGMLKSKSVTFVWEFMFTRAMYQTPDMIEQQHILNAVSKCVDNGELMTTLNHVKQPINAKNLRRVHADIEQGNVVGKVVLESW
ncbi:MAG: zinc-binding alcohol dehydrogenase family protein [Methylococcales bacterium]|jgi:zinc-binding alcohol dehydrogenase family protein|nr:zinc-binding alcohol dehydrogenase family protein [Methylococcales bacterium]MBT7442432.1 zinc-binding alcohol dehydrogenase family protein [Methylococcales bacterium]